MSSKGEPGLERDIPISPWCFYPTASNLFGKNSQELLVIGQNWCTGSALQMSLVQKLPSGSVGCADGALAAGSLRRFVLQAGVWKGWYNPQNFPVIFFITLFSFSGRQKVAGQDME